jgi:hypothetical protein
MNMSGTTLLTLLLVSGTAWSAPYDETIEAHYDVEQTDRHWSEPAPAPTLFSQSAHWVPRDGGTQSNFYGIGTRSNTIVAVGAGGLLHTSTNGLNWIAGDSGSSNLLMNVNGDGDYWLVVGDAGRILTSTNGNNWTTASTPTAALLRGIAYGDGVYIACGGDGTILRSTDASVWTTIASGTTEVLQGVAHGSAGFVIVGSGGIILTSPDGLTWTPRVSGTSNWLLDVGYGTGRYTAIGLGGVMRTSTNGETWTSTDSGTTEHLYRITATSNRWVAVGANGTISTATVDGDWTTESSGVTADLRGVAARADRVVAVGFDGVMTTREIIDDTVLPGDADATATQPTGALSDIIVYTSAGHGFTYIEANNNWRTQRPLLHAVVEDMGNLDQMNRFAEYIFRAGGTVVPYRPLGHQTNEVVLDNVDSGVTFNGTWFDSVSPIYYGQAAQTPYRYAYIDTADTTAWAVYRPDLPVAGFYPVYAWTRHGSDRVRQLYRIQHAGGVTEVRVNHRRVGNGWVWLGNYYFEAGTAGSVTIANHAPGNDPGNDVIIADAIRFGNGMGDVARGTAGISGFERELEAARYWVQRMVGQGMASTLYDNTSFTDWDDNIGAPPRMTAEMNRETTGTFWDRIFVGFHSNADGGAGTARGPMGLWDTRGTTLKQDRQKDFGRLMADQIHDDMTWAAANDRFLDSYANNTANLYGSGYGEIYGTMNDEMNSTIIETLFHNNVTDANLLKDPVARRQMARSCYHAIVHHLATNNPAVPLAFLPDPPTAISVRQTGAGQITLRWTPPLATPIAGDAPAGYVVYRSDNGYGFGNPVTVTGGDTRQVTLTGLPMDETLYFQIAAYNAGGESLPSNVVGVRLSANGQNRHVIINGFERNDRNQSPTRYFAHGLNGNVTLVRPRQINAFDYVIQHGEALAAADIHFDSGDNTALLAGDLDVSDYFGLYWFLGRESLRDETFTDAEQVLVADFLDAGGRLFLSGANISFDLGANGSITDQHFLTNYLTIAYASADAGELNATPVDMQLFDGIGSMALDDGSGATYRVAFPDVYHARTGSTAALVYGSHADGTAVAGITHTGIWRSVVLAFPFETIISASVREQMLVRVVHDFFGTDPLAIAYTTSTPVPVPHAWLRTHFGEDIDYEQVAQQTAANDMPVWQTYVAGLDPADPESQLRIQTTHADAATGPTLLWQGTSVSNRVYSVYWTTNLHTPMIPLQTAIPSTYPNTNAFTHSPPPLTPAAFYRIDVRIDEDDF